MQHAICPPAQTRMQMSFNGDHANMAGSHHISLLQHYRDHGRMHSANSSSTDTLTSSTPNHSDSSMQDHVELSTTGASTASSSSCGGGGASAAGALPSSLEEGQGESRCCDQSSARINSLKSIVTHDDVAYGFGSECQPCSRSGSATAATAVHHRRSCFGKDVGQEQEYFQQILGSSSYGWTDEKHSSYLDSMEADFLRSVMFIRGSVPHEEDCSSELSDSATSQQANLKCSKEFKVCQHGRWGAAKSVNASYNICPMITQVVVAVKNPWIKRFRSPLKRPKVSPSVILQHPLLHDILNSRKR